MPARPHAHHGTRMAVSRGWLCSRLTKPPTLGWAAARRARRCYFYFAHEETKLQWPPTGHSLAVKSGPSDCVTLDFHSSPHVTGGPSESRGLPSSQKTPEP